MIYFLTAKDLLFNYSESKELWERHKAKLDDGGDFCKVLANSHFYSFFEGEKFIGCLCFYEKEGRLYFNGFSNRKGHLINLECLKKAFSFYSEDIYAECAQRAGIFCLLRAGFKRVGTDLYMRGNKNG